MSQTRQQMIAIYIFPSICRSKGNKAMKFRQLMKYNVRNIFPQNHGELFPDHFCFLRKLYIRQKQVASTLVLIHFVRPLLRHTTKENFITF